MADRIAITIPEPYIRTAGSCYAWCCSGYHLDCLGDSRAEAECHSFEDDFSYLNGQQDRITFDETPAGCLF